MKWVRWLILLMIVMWICVGFLAVRVYLPVNPVKPYFLPSTSAVAGLHWPLARFQPVYLWWYNKSNGEFFKVAYRDGSNRIRLADIFIGGVWNGKDYKTVADSSLFHLGERIKIVYLETTNVITPEQEQIKSSLYKTSPELCQITDYIEKVGGFSQINKNKSIPKGIVIPAEEISSVTKEK